MPMITFNGWNLYNSIQEMDIKSDGFNVNPFRDHYYDKFSQDENLFCLSAGLNPGDRWIIDGKELFFARYVSYVSPASAEEFLFRNWDVVAIPEEAKRICILSRYAMEQGIKAGNIRKIR